MDDRIQKIIAAQKARSRNQDESSCPINRNDNRLECDWNDQNNVTTFKEIKIQIETMKSEIKEIIKTVAEYEDHFGNDLSPEIINSFKKLRDDMDSVIRKIQMLNEQNGKTNNKISGLELISEDNKSKFRILDSKIENITDNELPGLSNEMESIRERQEIIKKGTEDGYNSLREMFGKLSGQYNSIVERTTHDTNDLIDRISSNTDSIFSLKKRIDELPFVQQIANINTSLSNISMSLKDHMNKINSTNNSVNDLNSKVSVLSSDFNTNRNKQSEINSSISENLVDIKSKFEKFNSDYTASSKYLTDNIQFLLNDHTSDSELEKIKSQIKNLGNEISVTNSSLASFVDTIKTLETSGKQTNKDFKSLRADLTMRMNDQESKINSTNTRINNFEPTVTKVSELDSSVNNIETVIETLTSSVNTQVGSLSNLVSSLQTMLQDYNTSSSSRITSLETSDNDIRNKTSKNTTDILTIQTSLSSLQKTLSTYPKLQEDFNTLVTKVDDLNDETSTNTSDISSIKESILSLITGTSDNTSKITSLQNAIASLQGDDSGNMTDILSLKESIQSLTTGLSNTNVKVDSVQSTTATNGISISTIQSTISDYSSVKSKIDANKSMISDLQDLTNDYPEIKEDTLNAGTNINMLKTRVSSLENDNSSMKTQISSNTSSVNTNTNDIANIKTKVSGLDGMNNDVDNLKAKTAENSTNITSISSTMNDISTRTNSNTSSINTLQSSLGSFPSALTDINEIKSKITTLMTEIDTLQGSLDNYPNIQNDINQAKTNILALQSGQGSLTTSQASLQSMFNSLRSNVTTQITAIASEISGLTNLTAIEDDIDSLKQYNVTNDTNSTDLKYRLGRVEAELPSLREAYEALVRVNAVISQVTDKWLELDERWTLALPLFNRMTSVEAKVSVLQIQVENSDKRIVSLESGTNVPDDFIKLQTDVSGLSGSVTAIMPQLETMLTNDLNTNSKVQSLQTDMVTVKQDIEDLKNGNTDLSVITQIKTAIDGLKTNVESNSNTSGNLQVSLNSLNQEVEKLKGMPDITSLITMVDNLKSQLTNIQDEINDGDSTTVSQLAADIATLRESITSGGTSKRSSDASTMKWFDNYNVHSGKKDMGVTSIQDLNPNAQLYVDNMMSLFKGIRITKGAEIDKLSLGHNATSSQPYSLDVNGNVKINGQINGYDINDIGRGPKSVQQIDVALNKVYQLPYSNLPNGIRILLDNTYPVSESDTDGFRYWYNAGKLNILTGTNSVGTVYDTSGTRTPKINGKYHISVY